MMNPRIATLILALPLSAAAAPLLYSSMFYTLHDTPPFQVSAVGPRLCFSENKKEYHSSHNCRLQFASGLVVRDSWVYVAYGDKDCDARVAAIPLEAVLHSLRSATNGSFSTSLPKHPNLLHGQG